MSNQSSAQSSTNNISKTLIMFIAGMSSFLTPFTGSSVNIALPSIKDELALNAISLSWVATAYLMAAAIFLVPFGRLSDMFGRKKIFFIGIIIDAAASLMCTVSQSGTWLIAFRAMQGLGGAMIFGTGVAILTSAIPPKERGRALGINVAAVYTGLSAGPLIGGLLTEYFGWRSIFLLNAFLGLLLIIFVSWKLKGEWRGAQGEKFDYKGAIVYILSIFLLMYGLTLLPSPFAAALIVPGFAGFIFFTRWETRLEYPVLDISLFRDNVVFRYSNLAALINYGATYAVAFLLSLYLQDIKGFSPEIAGLILIAQPVIMVICSPIAGTLSDRVEPRIISSLGMTLTTAGLILLSFLSNNTDLYYIIICLFVLGFGFGFFSSPNTNAVMSSVELKYYGVASGMLGTMRLTGQMFSMVMTLMFFSIYLGNVQIDPVQYPLFLKSMKMVFIISAVLCFGGVFASIARGKTLDKKRP
jgi:EmrB/QacA subfamily drug resistance transporter